MVVSLLMMSVILMLGSAAGFLSLTNITISKNVETNLTTRYRAEAGVDTAIAYLQSNASGFLDNAEIDALVAEANNLSFFGDISNCPYSSDTGTPCVTVNRWTPETITINAIAGDPITNAEYVAEATIRLSPNSSSSPPIELLANGIIDLGAGVDLTGGTTQPYDDVIAHGNYGFSINPQVTLSTVNGEPGITASEGYSVCRGGGVVMCPPNIINSQSIDITSTSSLRTTVMGAEILEIDATSSEIEIEIEGANETGSYRETEIENNGLPKVSLTEGEYVTATQLNSATDSRSFENQLAVEPGSFVVVPSAQDIVFPEGVDLSNTKMIVNAGSIRINSNSSLENTHIITENGDIILEGNNIVFNNSSAIASDGIFVSGAVDFRGVSTLAGEGDSTGVYLSNSAIRSHEDLTIISDGVIQVNADIPLLRAGLQSRGNIELNGDINLTGFAQSEGDIYITSGSLSSESITSLVASEPKYTFGFILSRN
ncbi:MAG: hypothetical protein AB4050_18290 [Synechococcus sp.]